MFLHCFSPVRSFQIRHHFPERSSPIAPDGFFIIIWLWIEEVSNTLTGNVSKADSHSGVIGLSAVIKSTILALVEGKRRKRSGRWIYHGLLETEERYLRPLWNQVLCCCPLSLYWVKTGSPRSSEDWNVISEWRSCRLRIKYTEVYTSQDGREGWV